MEKEIEATTQRELIMEEKAKLRKNRGYPQE